MDTSTGVGPKEVNYANQEQSERKEFEPTQNIKFKIQYQVTGTIVHISYACTHTTSNGLLFTAPSRKLSANLHITLRKKNTKGLVSESFPDGAVCKKI
jgi:hypothetical protein